MSYKGCGHILEISTFYVNVIHLVRVTKEVFTEQKSLLDLISGISEMFEFGSWQVYAPKNATTISIIEMVMKLHAINLLPCGSVGHDPCSHYQSDLLVLFAKY